MTLPSDGPVAILPLDKYQPQGVPIGQHAFFLKMTPEALEQLSLQVAAQHEAAVRENQEMQRSNGKIVHDPSKKKDKPLMQLIVGENGQPEFQIGATIFKADAVDERAACEIYARHRSPRSDSDRHLPRPVDQNALQMVAKVDGRINLKREYGTSVQLAVSERTARLNKEAQPRSTIMLDSPAAASVSSGKNSSRAQQAKPSTHVLPSASATGRSTEAKGQAALTPPKSDGSPSSTSSSPRGTKHQIPDAFTGLNLTIPARWDRDVPIPIRVIHHLALKPLTESQLLTEAKLAAEAERREATRAMNILCERKSDGNLHLRDEAFYYLRPNGWVNYSIANRAEACKYMRLALRRLGYDDHDAIWEYLRRQPGWVDPWKNTPEGALYYREKEREKEQKKSASASNTKEDHEKRKADALANPAPMLTSSIKPGFYSSNPPAKAKKVTKEKEPKVKKEKTSVKKESDKESATQPRMAQGASQGSSTPDVEPTIQESEMRIREIGPGSASGKLAIAKRIQREKVEGFGSTVTTPTRSPRPLPGTIPNATNGVKSESKKRKAEDEDYHEGPTKKRKAPATSVVPSYAEPASRSAPTKKRKGDDIESLSPPPKVRKAEASSSQSTSGHSYKASTSSTHGQDVKKKGSNSRKEMTSATRDYNGKKPNGRPQWDYSSDEDGNTPLSKSNPVKREDPRDNRSASQLGLPVPHRHPPPTTYLGFKAVFTQKLSQHGMISGIIMGEQAKLENLGAGDDSSVLMSMDELKRLLRKKMTLEEDLKELKVEIARLVAKTT